MTDPKDLQHYLDEKIRERNKEDRQAQQRADEADAQLRHGQDRRSAAMALLTDTIIPFLEESKRTMTGVHLVVNPKVTNSHQVVGVAFQIRDRQDGAIRGSIFEINIGTEIPLVRSYNEPNEESGGIDLSDRVGIRTFEDLNTDSVAQLVRLAIDEYASKN
jgi:hypothetical protein